MHRNPFVKTFQNIASIISLWAAKTSSHVLNSKHFIGMMDVCVEAEGLVSFDVTSLFTNVPIDKAVNVIHRKHMEDLVEQTPLPAETIAALSEVNLL